MSKVKPLKKEDEGAPKNVLKFLFSPPAEEKDPNWDHLNEAPEAGNVAKKKGKKEDTPAVPFFKLWRFSKGYERFLIFLGILLSAGVGSLMPVQILIFGNFVSDIQPVLDDPTEENLLNAMTPTIKIIVYLGIAMFVAGYLTQMIWVYTGELQTRRIRQMYVHSILRQDMGWFDKAEEGSLTTRLSNDTQLVQEAISEKAGATIQCLAQFITGFVIAFVKGWRLAIVMFACVPLLAIVGGAMIFFIVKLMARGQDAYAEAGSIAEQAIAGIRTVYSFSLQKRFIERYNRRLIFAKLFTQTAGGIIGWGFGVFMLILFSLYGLAFWYGAKLVIDGADNMDSGKVLVVFLCMIMGAMGLMMLPPNLSAFATGRAAAYRIYLTIDRVPEIDTDSSTGKTLKEVKGRITFKDVKFTYPSRPDVPVLHDLSIDIKPGMTVAFVGPSGSGKSTSVALVQRFYDPLGGSVSLDDVDIKDLNVKWLRQQIGVVSQEPVLFNMTVKDNLLMGALNRDSITDADIQEACRKANAHHFIKQLPKGYNTLVGEHGGMMSGGQKQRIAIARALLKNPKILLLDEATSALDTQSEKLVQKALDVAAKDRTTIVIAHRLSTIKNADLIVVMDKGNLIERGTHQELYAQNGVYTELVNKQQIKMKEDPRAADINAELNDIELEKALENEKIEIVQEVKTENGDNEAVKISIDLIDLASPRVKKKQLEEEKRKRIEKSPAPIRRVISMMRPMWGYLVLGCFGALIAGSAFPLYGFIFSKIIVQLNVPVADIAPGPMEGTNLLAFLVVMVGVGALFGIGLQVHSFEYAGAALTYKVRSDTFAALLRQEVGFFDMEGNSLGALSASLATDAQGVNDMVTKVWGDIVQLISSAITGLIIAFFYSWQLALVILGCTPFIIISSFFEAKIFQGFEDKTKKAYAEAGEIAAEAFKEIRTVVSLTKEIYFEEKYAASIEGPHQLARRKAFLASLGYGAHQAFNMWTSAVGFYAGIRFIGRGYIDFQDMFVCILVLMITAGTVGRTSTFAAKFAKAKNGAINIFELLDRVSKIDPEAPGDHVADMKGDIDLKNIAFRYPARPDVPIFSGDFGFSGKAKQTIALVGPSGCGKSTTIGMLQRWYDPISGRVEIDHREVQTAQLQSLRSHMALVGQEPVLFDMTIRENIAYGTNNEDVTDEELIEVAKMANIHQFIVSLPQGFDTRVGDKGSQLSGGQKQRIAIARALIRKPKLLLLDEATSALDSESEKLVQQALDRAVEGRTTITIAHRLSTIQNADIICVVKDGKVIEQGKHFELLALNGVYKGLVDQQDLNALQ